MFSLFNLDLSDVARTVEDFFHILLADVVVVARRWSHLDKDLTKDPFINTIWFCQSAKMFGEKKIRYPAVVRCHLHGKEYLEGKAYFHSCMDQILKKGYI